MNGGNTASAQDAPAERFVPAPARRGVTLELRSEATVHGADVRLKNVCRWADSDAAFFSPVADLVIAHCNPGAAFQSVDLKDVRKMLSEAGLNVAGINFAGPTACTIARNDVHFSEQDALQQWIDAKQGVAHAVPADAVIAPATQPVVPAPAPASPLETKPGVEKAQGQSLRQFLTEDAAVRLGLAADVLQIAFSPADEKVLALANPLFKFNIDSRRVYNLGDVSWDVLVVTDTGSRKVHVTAAARAWESAVVMTKPLAARQIIRESDVIERRALVDRLADEPLVTLAQAVGQEASRDLKPGTVLTARMLDPVQLVKNGQFVQITLNHGGVKITAVARALENGSFGQSVRMKNEDTGETYLAVITGPQEATMGLASK
ncbi:MAG TPA: flagellar basal body P-ring formation chaperone FlgA [Humisphaera sp.]|jgi:flagella basal body P-ring formation protein FlgA|nr:flagellar basal body P-ring formation chaperone FlgA [Humisphaera sp.]